MDRFSRLDANCNTMRETEALQQTSRCAERRTGNQSFRIKHLG